MSFAGESGSGYAYRPALDGVRAVAVAAVLLFHGATFLPVAASSSSRSRSAVW
jgi:peptidoglycan/LPS O-acetylase OafA/YrhL